MFLKVLYIITIIRIIITNVIIIIIIISSSSSSSPSSPSITMQINWSYWSAKRSKLKAADKFEYWRKVDLDDQCPEWKRVWLGTVDKCIIAPLLLWWLWSYSYLLSRAWSHSWTLTFIYKRSYGSGSIKGVIRVKLDRCWLLCWNNFWLKNFRIWTFLKILNE